MKFSNQKSFFYIWLAFECLALLLRWPSFFPTVMDHDESTYIVIADSIRNGGIYYVDVIDNKPIGIFLLFALFQQVAGTSILAIRILAATWVALTATFLFFMHRRMQSSESAGWASGLMYVFMTSIFVHFGLSPNTELFYVLFTVAAFCLLLPKPGIASALLSGLLLGIGFLIKYVVAFDALALGLFVLFFTRKEGWPKAIRTVILMIIGFVLPLLMLVVYYHQAEQLDRLFYYTFELSYKYVSGRTEGSYWAFFGDLLGRFFPVTCWLILSLLPNSNTKSNVKWLSLVWFIACGAAIILQGKFFYHYFIQMMLPLSFGAGCFFDEKQQHGRFWLVILKRKTGGVALIALGVITTGIQVQQVMLRDDYPKQVAEWLQQHLQTGEQIYTGNYHQIVYHLTEKPSPSPYVHSTLLANEKHLFAQGISHHNEMKKIIEKKPKYILIQKEYPVKTSPIHQELQKNYQLVKTFSEDIKIFKRNQ